MVAVHAEDPRFKVLQLSRNFGHQIAITAGMDVAAGQAVIVMDADLQDPPEVILEMAARWREGFEVVYAVREHRAGETLFKRTTATLFYGIQRRLAEIEQPVEVGDFRLVDPEGAGCVLGEFRSGTGMCGGCFRGWGSGRRRCRTGGRRGRRGRVNIRCAGCCGLAFDGFVGFSTAPLRFALALGLFMAAASVLYGIVAIAMKLAGLALCAWLCFVAGDDHLPQRGAAHRHRNHGPVRGPDL